MGSCTSQRCVCLLACQKRLRAAPCTPYRSADTESNWIFSLDFSLNMGSVDGFGYFIGCCRIISLPAAVALPSKRHRLGSPVPFVDSAGKKRQCALGTHQIVCRNKVVLAARTIGRVCVQMCVCFVCAYVVGVPCQLGVVTKHRCSATYYWLPERVASMLKRRCERGPVVDVTPAGWAVTKHHFACRASGE